MLWLAHAWALGGRKTEARRLRAELEEPFRKGILEARGMALVDLALGESDRALARLRSACAAGAVEPLSPTPLFEPLRSDARIAAVLANCGKGNGAGDSPSERRALVPAVDGTGNSPHRTAPKKP
jgi:hypothetical protein